ncbi:MAG: hypothetical protein IIB02_07640 [Thaumarchaeota archaeon]|nr:hypothetical protein [Nitrososphaerota archaeon]
MTSTKQCQILQELDKKTVNHAVKICVNCDNISVHIENYGMFCKDCGSFFDVKKRNDDENSFGNEE